MFKKIIQKLGEELLENVSKLFLTQHDDIMSKIEKVSNQIDVVTMSLLEITKQLEEHQKTLMEHTKMLEEQSLKIKILEKELNPQYDINKIINTKKRK